MSYSAGYSDMEPREIALTERHREALAAFLKTAELRLEPDLEYAVGIYDNSEELVACGGHAGRVIKCLAVRPDYQSQGLLAKLATHLYTKLVLAGVSNVFVFTKPSTAAKFLDMNFYLVAQTDEAALLETRGDGIDSFVAEVRDMIKRAALPDAGLGCVVMNANPFTNGHLYLLEEAAKRCDGLVVFVVSENLSDFSSDVRRRLVTDGTRHICNLVVSPTSDYIVSATSFPSYFIKKASDIASMQASLDVTLFGSRIGRPLGIERRFVGTEPLDAMTCEYNRQMVRILPRFGIQTVEIERLTHDGDVVSASRVRQLLQQDEMEKVRGLVPPTTWEYLRSNWPSKS